MTHPSPYIKRAEDALMRAVTCGCLEVDDHGRIWRVGRMHMGVCQRGNVRRAEHLANEYLQVRAVIDGRRFNACAHRLVWAYFNGPIPDGAVINHINGNKTDNRPGNLEAVTPSENTAHAHRTGLIDQTGQRNPAARLSDADVEALRHEYANGGVTQAKLGNKYGIAFQTVSKIVRGDRRNQQPGPVGDYAFRRLPGEKDASTGRFVGKKSAGRLLDGREWNEFPKLETAE